MTKKSVDKKALAKAQDLMWTAFDIASRAKRLKLAKQALEISSDCADAYVMIASETKSLDRSKKIELLEEGVKAGKRCIADEELEEEIGHYWGILETRPYMRAFCALAIELERAGQVEEAIIQYKELLRLNPNDNQGVRHLLVPLYVSLDMLEEAIDLISQYAEDCCPSMAYSDVLLQFKQGGDTKDSRFALSMAVENNRHVVTWLLKRKFDTKRQLGDFVTVGGEDEAYDYVKYWRASWYETEGAIEWLVENLLFVFEQVCCGDDIDEDDEEIPSNVVSFFDGGNN